jgi:hypothetical protein
MNCLIIYMFYILGGEEMRLKLTEASLGEPKNNGATTVMEIAPKIRRKLQIFYSNMKPCLRCMSLISSSSNTK